MIKDNFTPDEIGALAQKVVLARNLWRKEDVVRVMVPICDTHSDDTLSFRALVIELYLNDTII